MLKSQETIEAYLKSLKELETDYVKDIEDVVGFIPTGWSHNFGLKYQKKNDDDENEMSGNTEYCLELMKNDRDNDDETKFSWILFSVFFAEKKKIFTARTKKET